MADSLGARKDGSWYAICIEPSITKTPVGPVQVPVPYQVISDLSAAMGTSMNVNFNGKPAYLLDQSNQPKCTGDEQGTSGGCRSATTSLEVKPAFGSRPTRINGKTVVHAGDLCTLNKENCRGKYITAPPPLSKADVPASQNIRLSMLVASPGTRGGKMVSVLAIRTPKEGTFKWSHSKNCRLVDASGHSSNTGRQLYVQTGAGYSDGQTYIEATVSVTDGVIIRHKTILIPPNSFSNAVPAPSLQALAIEADAANQWGTGGFRVIGESRPLQGGKKKKQAVSIVCFIDGSGNQMASRSNIFLMFDAVRRHEGKWPNDELVDVGYFAGPGAGQWDYAGAALGTGSMNIAERAYRNIADQYIEYIEDGYSAPKIDIYGFSRGSAVANEVAWFVNDRGIQDEDKKPIVPAHTVKVRFLGLFETVHSMGEPGPNTSNEWHHNSIAPIVENCAHAVGADETRIYFELSLLERIPGTGPKISELIFPGVHSDIGGHKDNNHDIMKLTRSWMADHATKAMAPYLKEFIISEAEWESLKNDPEKMKHGVEGYPKFLQQNPLYYEEKRREFANKVWGEKSGGMPPGLFTAITSGVLTVATAPILPVAPIFLLTPGEQKFAKQASKMHEKRRFPDGVDRLIPLSENEESPIRTDTDQRGKDAIGSQA